ncbi:MAG: hypothetical protein ABL957_12130 [Parvularculaceae bacterium]
MILRKQKPFPQLEGLISILFTLRAKLSDREMAASDLGAYDEPIAEAALIHVGSRVDEPHSLLEFCGTSLGDIWRRKRRFRFEVADALALQAKRGLANELKEDFPDEIGRLLEQK